MNLQERIELMQQLGEYLKKNDPEWQQAKQEAFQQNPWFIPSFIDVATNNIIDQFLDPALLKDWVAHYHLDDNIVPKNVGIVMAGNIPMVGFHDLLCVFISGQHQTIKLSSKDEVLLKFLVKKMYSMDVEVQNYISIASMLKGCDAYIATGSNNSSRYFEEYFGRFPNIIRKNRTSVAVLSGEETDADLEKLADDVHLYFGLGCRNVTKILVPAGYDFIPLLRSFDKYLFLMDLQKYKNNYDYQLSIILLNHAYYMTNGNTLLLESKESFSPISVLHYEFYEPGTEPILPGPASDAIQCIVGKGFITPGTAQNPGLFSYADGIDTMQFLLSL